MQSSSDRQVKHRGPSWKPLLSGARETNNSNTTTTPHYIQRATNPNKHLCTCVRGLPPKKYNNRLDNRMITTLALPELLIETQPNAQKNFPSPPKRVPSTDTQPEMLTRKYNNQLPHTPTNPSSPTTPKAHIFICWNYLRL